MLLSPPAWDAQHRMVALRAMSKYGVTRFECGRVVVSPATNEVASVVAVDGGTALIVWGAAAPGLNALLAERDALWCRFDEGASSTTALALATARSIHLGAWQARHPDVHVRSSPTAKEHLLISATPAEQWRCRPHIVLEAAIVMKGDSRPPRPHHWARTVAWVCADRLLHFEPPIARWRYTSAWNGMDDRSFWARRAFGRKDELLAPGEARINKLSKADFHATVPKAPPVAKAFPVAKELPQTSSVEAIEWLSPLKYGDYPDDAAAVLRLICLVEVDASLAATCIQRAWRLAVSNPAFSVCRRRLLREFTHDQPWCSRVASGTMEME
jgi:hypothetical protein